MLEVKRAMSHPQSSCQGRSVNLLKLELEHLYAKRSAVDAAIRALQGFRSYSPARLEAVPADVNLEFCPKPCNLTTCRRA
jgi:hypothetical protein